jgi:hypothetical protein
MGHLFNMEPSPSPPSYVIPRKVSSSHEHREMTMGHAPSVSHLKGQPVATDAEANIWGESTDCLANGRGPK